MSLTITYSRTDDPSHTNFQTNLGTIGFDQLAPDVLGLKTGGFVATYRTDISATQSLLRLNFYDASFNPIGSSQSANDDGNSMRVDGQPSLTQLSNGNVLVVWDENFSGEQGIHGRLFSPTGTAIGSELTFTDVGAAYDEGEPEVVALAGGGFVLGSTFFFPDGTSTVSVSRYDNAAQRLTLALLGNGVEPAVAALADGGYVATYTDNSDVDDKDIRASIFNADGSVRRDNFLINSNFGGGNQTQSKVVGRPNDGGFAVAYTGPGRRRYLAEGLRPGRQLPAGG